MITDMNRTNSKGRPNISSARKTTPFKLFNVRNGLLDAGIGHNGKVIWDVFIN